MGNDKLLLAISLVRERDSEIDQIVDEFMPLALTFTTEGPIPKTFRVFLSFIASTEFIKNGILGLAETENVYAAKILFRALIEHFLRFQYVWCRVCEDKSDAAAEDYLKHGLFKESLQIARSWKRIAKILGRDSRLTTHEAVRHVIKEAADCSDREINDQASQFEYARIIEYIFERLKLGEVEEIPFLLRIIPNYGDLSCFVHGAPGAMNIMASLADEGKLITDLRNVTELAFQIAGSVKMLSLLTFYKYDMNFGAPYLKVVKVLRSLGQRSK
jgi:hypothetical protein